MNNAQVSRWVTGNRSHRNILSEIANHQELSASVINQEQQARIQQIAQLFTSESKNKKENISLRYQLLNHEQLKKRGQEDEVCVICQSKVTFNPATDAVDTTIPVIGHPRNEQNPAGCVFHLKCFQDGQTDRKVRGISAGIRNPWIFNECYLCKKNIVNSDEFSCKLDLGSKIKFIAIQALETLVIPLAISQLIKKLVPSTRCVNIFTPEDLSTSSQISSFLLSFCANRIFSKLVDHCVPFKSLDFPPILTYAELTSSKRQMSNNRERQFRFFASVGVGLASFFFTVGKKSTLENDWVGETLIQSARTLSSIFLACELKLFTSIGNEFFLKAANTDHINDDEYKKQLRSGFKPGISFEEYLAKVTTLMKVNTIENLSTSSSNYNLFKTYYMKLNRIALSGSFFSLPGGRLLFIPSFQIIPFTIYLNELPDPIDAQHLYKIYFEELDEAMGVHFYLTLREELQKRGIATQQIDEFEEESTLVYDCKKKIADTLRKGIARNNPSFLQDLKEMMFSMKTTKNLIQNTVMQLNIRSLDDELKIFLFSQEKDLCESFTMELFFILSDQNLLSNGEDEGFVMNQIKEIFKELLIETLKKVNASEDRINFLIDCYGEAPK